MSGKKDWKDCPPEYAKAKDPEPEVESHPEPEPMSDTDYSATQEQLKLLAAFILPLNLKGCFDRIQSTAALAPLFNPNLWMIGSDRLEIVAKLTRAAYKFQKVVKECNAELEALPPVRDIGDPFGLLGR